MDATHLAGRRFPDLAEACHHFADERLRQDPALRLLADRERRPKRAGPISPPALFRAVEEFQPTILLDETETYIEHGSDLHALLNEGHCQGGTVLRVLGEQLELREFSVFGAVAFGAMAGCRTISSNGRSSSKCSAGEPMKHWRSCVMIGAVPCNGSRACAPGGPTITQRPWLTASRIWGR